jgi:hypothetical protein
MPRQARLDAAGTLHHVMIRGIERRRIVDDEQDQRNFVLRLGKLASETSTSIYAWALMSNHWSFGRALDLPRRRRKRGFRLHESKYSCPNQKTFLSQAIKLFVGHGIMMVCPE